MRGPLALVMLLSLGAASAAADTVTVIARRANVRAEPSAMSALVATVESGTRLLVEGREGDWVKVQLPETVTATTRTGYILSALVRAASDADAAPAGTAAGTAPATGSGVAINHEEVGCVVAERYPRFEACLDPADSVSRARVHFRAGDSPHWYFVEMAREGVCHAGVIPMPKKTTRRIDYYIEAVDRSFNEARTAEHAPRVVEAAEGCRNKVAGALSSASVLVGSLTGGASSIPVGFMPLGVTPMGTASAASTAASQVAGRTDAATAAAQPSASTPPADATTVGRTTAAAGGGSSIGKILLIGGLLAGGAAAAVVLTSKEDPLDVDDDGDGFTENEGDCNDSSATVSPQGGFEFTMDFAYSGTVSCSSRNARQQVYTVRNDSCTPLSLQGLNITLTLAGGGCSASSETYPQPLDTQQAAPGTTTVVRRGAPAGTVAPLCCPAYPCRTGSCTLTFSYTLNTSAGSRTIPQTYNVVDNTGRECPVCGTIGVDETFGFSSAPGVRACVPASEES